MKNKDFMIGNYISDLKGETHKVLAILSDDMIRTDSIFGHSFLEANTLKGILVSGEKLKELGFEENTFTYGYEGFGFTIYLKYDREKYSKILIMYNGKELCVKNYVHELQNLIYSITESELHLKIHE